MASSSKQLNVSITPHFSRFISGKVKSGRYSNASEVVREALRRLEQEDLRLDATALGDPDDAAEKLAVAEASLDQGHGIDIADEDELARFFAQISQRGHRRLAEAGPAR